MQGPLHEQLRRAWVKSGLSQLELIQRASLNCSLSAMSRKLRGKQALYTFEVEAMATALGVVVRAGAVRRRGVAQVEATEQAA